MKNFLLDTHTLLWHLEANPRLSQTAFDTIEDLEKSSFVSHVTLWEIAIKLTIGKLTLQIPFPDIEKKLIKDGFRILPISSQHIIAYSELPLHHRDPFDRLLIAQAIAEVFPILGDDGAFDAYPVVRVW